MRLQTLLRDIAGCGPFTDQEITGITNDSRRVKPGMLYVAIPGSVTDGHRYVPMAAEKGAAAMLVQHPTGEPKEIVVENTHQAYAQVCAHWFGDPAEKLRLVGITGTNGKTSVTTMLKHILEDAGEKTGLIGTIQVEYGDVVEETGRTTPDAYVFQEILARMVEAGCTTVVSEVSSHALDQDRLFGCRFAVSAFTNLTQDHLDYHGTMEHYFAAKCKLFSMSGPVAVNVRDPYGRRVADCIGAQARTFSIEDPAADYFAGDIRCTPGNVSFTLGHDGKRYPVVFAIPGRYSVENAMTALVCAGELGIAPEAAIASLGKMQGVAGRNEVIFQNETMTVLRDYGHTPDGIENVLRSAREYVPGRLVALFGCGGDRDRTKRPKMAAACEAYADFIIVTSDNPRSEDPEAIIAEVLPGLSGRVPYVKITDRREAIAYAMRHARKDDTIMLLGKGHEDYQILKDRTIPFDEREIVAEIARTLEE